MAAPQRKGGPAKAGPQLDPQEERALDRAGEAVARFGPGSPRSLAAVAISEWIVSRTSSAASIRFNADLLFDLGDARLRGFIEAALPAIGNALVAGNLQHIPTDEPIHALSKGDMIDFIMVGILGAQEAAVSAQESLGFPFDDDVPFGGASGPIKDGECSH